MFQFHYFLPIPHLLLESLNCQQPAFQHWFQPKSEVTVIFVVEMNYFLIESVGVVDVRIRNIDVGWIDT